METAAVLLTPGYKPTCPGAGWIDFDPTNSIVGNRNLIRVGVAWSPDQVLPLSGTYLGPPEAFQGMDVTVTVSEVAG